MEWSTVTGAVTNIMSVVSTVVSTVADNALLMALICVPVLGAGIKVFKKLIRVAH